MIKYANFLLMCTGSNIDFKIKSWVSLDNFDIKIHGLSMTIANNTAVLQLVRVTSWGHHVTMVNTLI